MVQDARAQQNVTDLGRLDVEHFVHQIAGQGAVLGYQLLDKLVRVGMSVQGDRGQPEAGRPALSSPGQALQQVRRQRPAVLSPAAGRLLRGAERQVAGPDLGQLASQPVAVQRKQRIHPRGDRQAQARPHVAQHEVKALQHPRLGQQVQVVEDQRHRRVLRSQRRRKPQQETLIARPAPIRRPATSFGMATPDRRNAATT